MYLHYGIFGDVEGVLFSVDSVRINSLNILHVANIPKR